MNIGIDVDNVISNFNQVLLNEYLKHDKKQKKNGIVNNTEYIRGMFDWSTVEENEFYRDNIERIAKNLDVVKGARTYIDKLRKDGHVIYIITGRDNGEYSNPYEMTKKWLNKKKINYDYLLFTNAYNKKSKAQICLKNNIDIMIDDSASMCLNCVKHNIATLIMDTPFNRAVDITRVYNWKEIYEYIANYKKDKIKVILDTDTYNECDDQFALAYMLKSQNILDIQAITIAPYSHTNQDLSIAKGSKLSYNEVIKICNWLNFDTNNKVFKGSTDFITNDYNCDYDAVNKIIEIALNNKKTYVMCIGALTNVALAIKKNPKIINKIEIIWLGGNSLLQKDNNEFNFRQDIKAVKIVFESKVKLTIIPCKNVASNLRTSIYELNYYLKDKNKLCNYLINRFFYDGYHEIKERRVIWDISVIAYLINKSWFHSEDISCPKINNDTSYKKTKYRHKITMVNYLDVDKIFIDMFSKLGN